MKSASRFVVLTLLSCGAVATTLGQQFAYKPVAPAQMFDSSYLNVRAPNADGWGLMQSSPAGITFAKRTPVSTFAASVLIVKMPPTETSEQFVALIKEGIEKDTDANRFTVIRSSTEYANERPYPCARHRSAAEDRGPQAAGKARGALLLEIESLYCRHPVHTESVFAIMYSHRGRNHYDALEGEAREFEQGVQVP